MRLRLIYIGLVAMLLTACTAVTDDTDVVVPEVSKRFINLSIAVTNSNGTITRGTPTGGENGDGREAGFNRENAVTGITLLLYQDAAGINTASNPTIDFVAYYPVSRSGNPATAGTPYNEKAAEAVYQTGNQLVPQNAIDFTKTYRAIVVANADLTGSITAGSSHLNDLRNMTLDKIYSGDETKPAASCGNFVMSSEQDQTLSFAAVSASQDAAGDYYYDLTTQPLVIERMAARIDFWAVNGTYKADKSGYVYDVEGGDKFVVTAIMPFNLTNKHNTFGKEYLLKRLTASLSTVTTQWLVSEGPYTTDPAYYYVLDPQTLTKVTAAHPSLTNSLESVKDLSAEAFASSSYCKKVADMHAAVVASGTTSGYGTLSDMDKSGEDVIVAYPMENTLLPESPLYYHATGIAVEGYYYKGGLTDSNPDRYVYYGYLRHQGEGESYDILTSNETTEVSSATPMNFGIVRNNIYRVWIGGIDNKRNLTLRIVVKKWDKFTHAPIYM